MLAALIEYSGLFRESITGISARQNLPFPPRISLQPRIALQDIQRLRMGIENEALPLIFQRPVEASAPDQILMIGYKYRQIPFFIVCP